MEQLRRYRQSHGPAGSRGFVLGMAVIVLVVISISALMMMKMMDAGIATAGNIAFRQAAVRAADLALEDANTWMQGQSSLSLQNDAPASGYYASDDPNFTPQGFSFTNSAIAKQYTAGGNDTFSGYKIYYVIHRMAATSGSACSDPTSSCVMPIGASSSSTVAGSSHMAGGGYQASITGATGLVYYRVTAKVVGPRLNNSYVQALLY